jgi:hypothetical protein
MTILVSNDPSTIERLFLAPRKYSPIIGEVIVVFFGLLSAAKRERSAVVVVAAKGHSPGGKF